MTGGRAPRFSISGAQRRGLVIAAASLAGCSQYAYLRFVTDSQMILVAVLSLAVVVASSTSLVWGLLIVVTDEWRPLTPVRTAIIPFVTVVVTLLSIALFESYTIASRFGSIYPLHEAAIVTLTEGNIEWVVPAALFPILGSSLRQRNRSAVAGALLLILLTLSQLRNSLMPDAISGAVLLAIFAIVGGIGPGLLGYYATEPVEATHGNTEASGDEAGGAESAS